MLQRLIHKRGWSWYKAKTPWWLMKLYPNLLWKMKESGKKVYLTFDDGPIPEVTEFVLDTLLLYNVKAHFFCIGKNVAENLPIFERIKREGHMAGNHTFNHLNGWKTPTDEYLLNIEKAAGFIQSDLFRPPYGRIKRNQIKKLQHYNIIMWDVLSGDFDVNLTPEQCLQNVINHIEPGSIIVFHDSVKAFERVQYALPKTLEWLKENGYECDLIKKEAFD